MLEQYNSNNKGWHKVHNPCRVCGGYNVRRNSSNYCWGFSDGNVTWCTRHEYSGSLSEGGWRYRHWFGSKCDCGITHDGSYQPVAPRIEPVDSSAKINKALAVWNETVPIDGTDAEGYLNSRGIDFTAQLYNAFLELYTIRYHEGTNVWVESEQNYVKKPALVSAIRTKEFELTGLNLTFLDGSRKAKLSDDPKDCKRTHGIAKHSAIYLADPKSSPETGAVHVCTGIENGLSIQQLTGVPTIAVTGDRFIPDIDFDNSITKIYLHSDGDRSGLLTGKQATEVFENQNIQVVRKQYSLGKDANDLLMDMSQPASRQG